MTGTAIAAWGLSLIFTAGAHAEPAQVPNEAVTIDSGSCVSSFAPSSGPLLIARSDLPAPRAGSLIALGIAAGLRRQRRRRADVSKTPNTDPLTYRPVPT